MTFGAIFHLASLATRASTMGVKQVPTAGSSRNTSSAELACSNSSSGRTSCATFPAMTPDASIAPSHLVSASEKKSLRRVSSCGSSSTNKWHSCSSPCAACETTQRRAAAFHSTTWNT